nr:nucleoporin [Quercus suber]
MAQIAAPPATPQRPLPGAFLATPAPAPTIFAQQAATLRQGSQTPAASSNNDAQRSTVQTQSSVEQAASTINDALALEARFPDLESYIQQGASGDYELSSNPAWLPFQKLKMYELPARILEQAAHAGIGMSMGVFPVLSHAWIALDNNLYLWDYTMPNPELIGYEDNREPITAVKLIAPRPGVFVDSIKHLIVVATQADMTLLGVGVQETSMGAKTISLFNTKMTIPIRGLNVQIIEASQKTGRIFFTGVASDDIYEFRYQQDEGWFSGKTSRICHTKTSYAFGTDSVRAVGALIAGTQKSAAIKQLVLDDSRNLLYSLSSSNEIKVWLVRDRLTQQLVRPYSTLLQSLSHSNMNRTELLWGRGVSVRSLSPVPATEASRLCFMATTNTGCRLYISLSRGFSYSTDPINSEAPPTSMQVLHVRFPPKDPATPTQDNQAPQQTNQNAVAAYGGLQSNIDINSRTLDRTKLAQRVPPGYFLAFQEEYQAPARDRVFCAAPDFARLNNSQDNTQIHNRFSEFGQWISLSSDIQDVQLVTPPLSATGRPLGFGNEMALQFDQDSTEIAIMTSTGVQTIRRRRLVDVFAGMLRYASTDEEGRDGHIKRFVRTYGRTETAATSLAVACGKGADVSTDSHLTAVTDNDVIDGARKAFIDHGGKPELNANAVDNNGSAGNVRPSPRHDGIVLYISRLVRSMWNVTIVKQLNFPGQPPTLVSSIGQKKLRSIQTDLKTLLDFLNRNQSFIEGLAGPQATNRPGSRQEEIALQGEHKYMSGLLTLIQCIIEGISFVLVLFGERVEDILAALSPENRHEVLKLTFQALFVSSAGRSLAKDLVKAIVNRNIASGSNVDTVADALRRRCGSFCSADDVVIFKAQEQVKRASEAGSQSETGRALLNESQRLFTKVAGSLTDENLDWATSQYKQMSFYAGAIQLCLAVAQQKDRVNAAASWLKDGCPEDDGRQAAFQSRKTCYDLVFSTIEQLDQATINAPERIDGHYTIAAKRRSEAYDVVNGSEDVVFLTCLYDWYLDLAQPDRLLDIDSRHVVDYLQRQSQTSREHADLLWKYFAHHNQYLQAAHMQLELAKSGFEINLEERIGYLSRARTNASTRQTTLTESRQTKQQILRDVSDTLDAANIQDELLQRMKSDARFMDERRAQIVDVLDGAILSLAEMYNEFIFPAEYYDICLLSYQIADHRNPADIRAAWAGVIQTADDEAIAGKAAAQPWEVVGAKILEMGRKLNISDATFPIQTLVPMVERYFIKPYATHPPTTWPVDIFLDLDVPHELLLPAFEGVFYGNEEPFNTPSKRRIVGVQMVYLLQRWLDHSERVNDRVVCGNEDNATAVLDCSNSLLCGGILDERSLELVEQIKDTVQKAMYR